MLTKKVIAMLEIDILLNDFLNCCDVLCVAYNLDFTGKDVWACPGQKVRNYHVTVKMTFVHLLGYELMRLVSVFRKSTFFHWYN